MTPPTSPTSDADVYFAVDFDGDGTDELVTIGNNQVRWSTHEQGVKGGLIGHAIGSLNGDTKESLVLLMGRTRENPEAKPEIIRVDGSELTRLYIGTSKLERLTDVRIGPKGVFATRMDPDKVARGGWVQDGKFRGVTESIMGLQQAPLSDGSIAVGRLYGDEPRTHGGLEIHHPDAPPTILPTLRGVRSLEVMDVDRDGAEDLLVADGWHFRYGQDAQARLTLYRGPDFTDKRFITEIDSAYTIDSIHAVRTPSNHPQPILITTESDSYLLLPETVGWRSEAIKQAPGGTAPIVVEAPKRAWIMVDGTSQRDILVH